MVECISKSSGDTAADIAAVIGDVVSDVIRIRTKCMLPFSTRKPAASSVDTTIAATSATCPWAARVAHHGVVAIVPFPELLVDDTEEPAQRSTAQSTAQHMHVR